MSKKPKLLKPVADASPARFTDTARIKALIALMADNGLSEIELVEDKAKIVLRRGGTSSTQAPIAHYAPAPSPASQLSPQHSALSTPALVDETAGLIPIKSPMVGTFYSSANPETDAYISIGTSVDPKSVVCIIEAMKVFNEIHAEVQGQVVKILVNNGQAVEFGQPLFLVKP